MQNGVVSGDKWIDLREAKNTERRRKNWVVKRYTFSNGKCTFSVIEELHLVKFPNSENKKIYL